MCDGDYCELVCNAFTDSGIWKMFVCMSVWPVVTNGCDLYVAVYMTYITCKWQLIKVNSTCDINYGNSSTCIIMSHVSDS